MRTSHAASAAILCLAAALVSTPRGAHAGAGQGVRPADWLSAVERRVAEEEYRITWQARTGPADRDGSWQAPNRAHGFRTHFTRDGIRVVPRIESGPSWTWGLELTGYGRGNRVWPVTESSPQPEGNRVDYARDGIVEWYVNDPRGLEQGFTLWAPPEDSGPAGTEPAATAAPGPAALSGGRAGGPAYLELTLTGSLAASAAAQARAVDFRTGGGDNVLRYSALRVTDAAGRELASWMEFTAATRARRIRLVFDDEDAVYPLTVDPLATSPSWTADGDQDGMLFGFSLGTAGDVNGDGFDDLIVGAPLYDGGQADEGRAFVYHGAEDAGLGTEPSWTAESDQAGARFGHSVGTAGDVNGDGYDDVIVGAPRYDVDQPDEARVLLVLEDAGAAFVYLGSYPDGLGTSPAWMARGDQAGARFGFSVGTAGDVDSAVPGFDDVVVGAPLYDGEFVDEGRVYLYLGSDAGPSTTAAWTAGGGQVHANFGHAAGTAGDVNCDGVADLAVGAPLYDDAETDEGRAYVYYGAANTGPETDADWTIDGGQAYANLGSSLGSAGDVNCDACGDLVVGAFHYGNGEAGEGQAYVFHGSGLGLGTSADWTAESDQDWAYFGAAVATAGNVDNDSDGCSEVLVGAYGYNGERSDAGRVYLFRGVPGSGLESFPIRILDGDQTGAGLGAAVGTAGDVNGDGFADVAAGAPFYYVDGPQAGRAIVYHGAEPVLTDYFDSYLGDAPPIEVEEDVFEPVDLDEDLFTFRGTETEEVTVTLEVLPGSTSAGGRASLYLLDAMGDEVDLFEVDRSDLANVLTAVLPASGDYIIAVIQQPDVIILPGLPFTGDYRLTLASTLGASGSLEPTDSVEQEDSAAVETTAPGIEPRRTRPLRRPPAEARRRPAVR